MSSVPFGMESYLDGQTSYVTEEDLALSSVPFGMESYLDVQTEAETNDQGVSSHQCLSAWSPIWTYPVLQQGRLLGWCHQCLSAWSPIWT